MILGSSPGHSKVNNNDTIKLDLINFIEFKDLLDRQLKRRRKVSLLDHIAWEAQLVERNTENI